MENQNMQDAPATSMLPSAAQEIETFQLVKAIRAGDESLFPTLWDRIEKLCVWYCRRLYNQLPRSFLLEYDDLFDCGFIALHDAVEHYDLERASRFSTFYLFYLTGAIFRENGLDKGGHNADGTRRFDPSVDTGTVRIDAGTDESGEMPGTLADVLSSDSVDSVNMDSIAAAENAIYYEQLHEALEVIIAMLPPDERHMIRQRYYARKARKSIARELCISPCAAANLENHALVTLRRMGRSVQLEQYLDSQTNFYAGHSLRRFKETQERSVERIVVKRLDLETRYLKLNIEAEHKNDLRKEY